MLTQNSHDRSTRQQLRVRGFTRVAGSRDYHGNRWPSPTELAVEEKEIIYKLAHIFQPYHNKRAGLLNNSEQKKLFAHYTSAENALNIVRGRQLWMRNAGVMNDFSEIGYGQNVLAAILTNGGEAKVRAVLDAVGEGMGKRVLDSYKASLTHVRETVFMTSLCEQSSDSNFGKLSMWRAYGGKVSGVALLFENHITNMKPETELNLALLPIFYGDQSHYVSVFDEFMEALTRDLSFLKSIPTAYVEAFSLASLQFAGYTIKHPAFQEEEEWRVIYRPFVDPSPVITKRIENISGFPQIVHTIPFHNPNSHNPVIVPELDLNKLLVKVQIGPCTYPETVFRAMVDALEEAGIDNPISRVTYTDIPMRQRG